MKTFEITFRLSMKNIQSAFDTQFDFSSPNLTAMHVLKQSQTKR